MSYSKVWKSAGEAVADISDGSVVLVGGFGDVGVPFDLLHALAASAARDLTIVANNCGTGEVGIARLIALGKVSRLVASFPLQKDAHHFVRAHSNGHIRLELVPQGTLAARLHAGGSGLAAVYTPTGVGTELAEGKETRAFDGGEFVLETALKGDFALVHAAQADEIGNLRFRRTARNFNPLAAKAARTTIVEAEAVVPAGEMDPDEVHTASVFVDRVVRMGV